MSDSLVGTGFVDNEGDSYTVLSRIGGGVQGAVYEVRRVRDQLFAAAKFFASRGERDREAAILLRLGSVCNVVACGISTFEYNRGSFCCGIVMNLVSGATTAYDFVRSVAAHQGDLLWDYIAVLVGARIAYAVVQMHKAGIAHNDLHPWNVLITEDDTVLAESVWAEAFPPAVAAMCATLPGPDLARFLVCASEHPGSLPNPVQWIFTNLPFDVRIIDFGLASLIGEPETYKNAVRDPTLRIEDEPGVDPRLTDSWDFGVMLHILARGYTPWAAWPTLPGAWDGIGVRGTGTKAAVRDAILREANITDQMTIVGQNLVGVFVLPAPFTHVSALLAIDYRERITVSDAFDMLSANVDATNELVE